jgi:hypothetical protein
VAASDRLACMRRILGISGLPSSDTSQLPDAGLHTSRRAAIRKAETYVRFPWALQLLGGSESTSALSGFGNENTIDAQHRRRMMRVSSRPCSLAVLYCPPSLRQGLGSRKSGNFSYPNARATGARNIPHMSIRMRRRKNAAGKFNRQLGKYPGRPNRQFLELWKMPGGFEAVSRANPWLFAGPGIGTKYLSIRRHALAA